MHLGGHLLRVRVVAAGQLFQVQAEVTRHDTLGREIGQAHVVQDPTARTSRSRLPSAQSSASRPPATGACETPTPSAPWTGRGPGRARRRSAPGRRSDWCRCDHSTAGCPIDDAAHMLEQFTRIDQEQGQFAAHGGLPQCTWTPSTLNTASATSSIVPCVTASTGERPPKPSSGSDSAR